MAGSAGQGRTIGTELEETIMRNTGLSVVMALAMVICSFLAGKNPGEGIRQDAGQEKSADVSARERVAQTLDAWHRAAANAHAEAYFGTLAEDAIFFGTDMTERWDLHSFRAYLDPIFAEGRGFEFRPHDRHVSFNDEESVAWFDEKLRSDHLGHCRATGVARRAGDEWKIVQYHLTLPVPNDLIDQVIEMIEDDGDGGAPEPAGGGG